MPHAATATSTVRARGHAAPPATRPRRTRAKAARPDTLCRDCGASYDAFRSGEDTSAILGWAWASEGGIDRDAGGRVEDRRSVQSEAKGCSALIKRAAWEAWHGPGRCVADAASVDAGAWEAWCAEPSGDDGDASFDPSVWDSPAPTQPQEEPCPDPAPESPDPSCPTHDRWRWICPRPRPRPQLRRYLRQPGAPSRPPCGRDRPSNRARSARRRPVRRLLCSGSVARRCYRPEDTPSGPRATEGHVRAPSTLPRSTGPAGALRPGRQRSDRATPAGGRPAPNRRISLDAEAPHPFANFPATNFFGPASSGRIDTVRAR